MNINNKLVTGRFKQIYKIVILSIILISFISVASAEDIDFTATPTSGEIPLSIQVSPDIPDNMTVTQYDWTLQINGTSSSPDTSSDQSPEFIINTQGSYDLTLAINTESNGVQVLKKPEYISALCSTPKPIADFDSNVSTGYAPLTVQFNDQSQNTVDGWTWTFEQDQHSSSQNPVYTYDSPGQYSVSLIVSNINGSDMETKIDYITVEEEPVPAPIITDFTIFDNSSSPTIAFKQTNDYADTIRWDFGDGNINNNVQASQNVIQHTYTETGTYTVNITAFNSEGQDSEELEVTIESIPTPPISDFSINLLTNEHELPATIQLIDNSSHTTEWNWDTNGDGIFELNTETPENITFYEYGTHQITLEVSNEYGSDSTTKSITLSTDKADISGSVEWLDNAKINEATVELYHSNGTLYSSCTTDSNGDYTFTDVPLGEYDIKIIKDGFYPEVQGISALSDSVPMGSKNVQKFGDIDDDGRSSGATDLTLMLQASVSDIQGDRYFDLNEDGRNADACDLTLMLQACVGDITF